MASTRRCGALAVLAVAAWLGAPGATPAAAGSDPLPPPVADLHRALRSRDHAIVYRLTPGLVIERVIVGDREPGGERDAATSPSAGDVAPLPPGSASRSADAEEARTVAPAVPVPVAAPPLPVAPPGMPPSPAGPDHRATTHPTPSGAPAIDRGVPASEDVRRQILERVGRLVEQTRQATLDGGRRPAQ